MAYIDLSEIKDPTLEAMRIAIATELLEQPEHINPDGTRNIGASMAGQECSRRIWYYYNGYPQEYAEAEDTSLAGYYAARDGDHVELVLAERLRKVKGIELITHGEDGKQLGFKDFGGKFKGKIDGLITGLLQAPTKQHIWEAKCSNQKKFDLFKKCKREFGEKNALQKWDFIYYTQAQIYMHKFKLDRHYLTVATPGARDIASCRTEYNKQFAEAIDMKIARIINAKSIPTAIGNPLKGFSCMYCPFKQRCISENS